MPWLQLHIDVPADQAPLLELVFENLGALSVTLGDAGDNPILEPIPGDTHLWQHTRVTALFDAEQDREQLQTLLNQTLNGDITRQLEFETLNDQVWERAWMKNFGPMRFGNRLWIHPEGQLPNARDAVMVQLDPGLAFGTGTHATTALCLDWLDGTDLTGKTIIDYGCGSGILAIAALRLGATSALAVDHDPQALEATVNNALKNGVADRLGVYSDKDVPEVQADILLGNILAGILIDLSEILGSRVKPGGRILLSGILAEQSEQVSRIYGGNFCMQPPVRREEWVRIEGRKNK